MAHYKRRRPRSGGCLMCKRQKMVGQKADVVKTLAEKRADLRARDED